MSLWDEILEQPHVLERLLHEERGDITRLASGLRRSDVRYVVIAARGTSDNAARYAQYLWGIRNGLLVALAAPSLFGPYRSPPSLDHAFVVAISQSGQSPDVVSVLTAARQQGRPTLAITNDPHSPLAAESDGVLPLHAGPEGAVAATKTYTAELFAVAMLSAALADDPAMLSELAWVPELANEMLGQTQDIEAIAASYRDIDRAAVLARGLNLCTAFEWALKLQEMCGVLAQPFSTADFEHGPIAVMEPGFPVFAVLPPGPLLSATRALTLRLVEERKVRLMLVAGREAAIAYEPRIALPGHVPEWISPIPAIIGAQLFSYHLAIARGLDPDAPRELNKVTRTR
jgi:glucosamine--fructose-6-phosphate aminotransferase (isomerizing)